MSVQPNQLATESQPSELNWFNIFESMEQGFASCQMIYDNAGVPIDFRYLYVNPAFAKQTGLTVEQVTGHNVKEVIPGIEPFWIETYARVVQSGLSEHFENQVASIGKQFDIKAWRTSTGRFAVVFEDITQRKNTEEKLRLSELRYHTLFETAQDGILILDAFTGKIVDANPFLEKILIYSRDELLGKELWQIGAFKDITESKLAFTKLQTNAYIRYENLPLQTKDGRSIDVEFVSNLYLVGGDKVIQCNIRDITESRKVQEKLSLQATALNAAANGIVISDINGVIEWVNPAFTKLTGFTDKEAVGQSTRLLRSGKQDKLFYQKMWDTILSGEVWQGELVNRKKDGSLYLEEQIITPVKNGEGKITGFIAVKQDVTARKKLEEDIVKRNIDLENLNKKEIDSKKAMVNMLEDLEKTKKTLEEEKVKDDAILSGIGEGMLVTDQNAKVIFMNEVAERLVGWKKEDVIGKSWFDLIPMEDANGNILTDDKRPITQAISERKRIASNSLASGYYFVRKDRTKVPIAVTATPIILNGQVTGAIGMYRDITREIETDKAKNDFISVASHQLRTPLGIMKWSLEALRSEYDYKNTPPRMQKFVEEIYANNERELSLVRDLLSVSRIDEGRVKNEPKTTNVVEEVENIVKRMRAISNNKKISLNRTCDNSQAAIPIKIDSMRFNEVLENLLINAIEYTMPNGLIDVEICLVGENVEIKVKDNGIGISQEDQKKIFGKFFRADNAAKLNSEGSGLGLFVVKSYVEGWGGKISVQSEEGKGSTFTITLPLSQQDKQIS